VNNILGSSSQNMSGLNIQSAVGCSEENMCLLLVRERRNVNWYFIHSEGLRNCTRTVPILINFVMLDFDLCQIW